MNKYLKYPERLIEVRDCIANNPERFKYTDWIDGDGAQILGKEMQCNDNWCGTCACVAGHAVSFACPANTTLEDFIGDDLYGDKACEVFGSDPNNVDLYLFLFMPWEYEVENNDIYGKYDVGGGTLAALYDIQEFAVKEAVSRINWILEEKPLEDYSIDLNLINDFMDRI